jgi:hypothetical protein
VIENQHTTKYWSRLSMNYCTHFWWLSLHTCVSTKSSNGLDSCSRTATYNKKMLSFKYIYKKKLIKNGCNKKILPSASYAKWTERSTPILVIRTRLWPSSETCGCHVLNVFYPYSLWDVRQSEIQTATSF